MINNSVLLRMYSILFDYSLKLLAQTVIKLVFLFPYGILRSLAGS